LVALGGELVSERGVPRLLLAAVDLLWTILFLIEEILEGSSLHHHSTHSVVEYSKLAFATTSSKLKANSVKLKHKND
jgi:hypothetical protein